ncbi:MAG: DNA repair and recombination protein RadB [Candidatus Hydrothermarchaeales archaeon]
MLEPYSSKEGAKKIPVGCGIDDILDGGIEARTITQLYGPAGSGKTNICLQCALNCIRSGKKVIFIDTEGGRSLDRVRQISGRDFEKFLENSLFYEPTNFEEQQSIIENLDKVVDDKVGLIVLDSAVSYYRLERNDESASEVNKAFSKQFAKLSELARKGNLAVIITNQVYTYDSEVEPVGGDILKYWCKAIVEVEKDGKERAAILRRHRSLPEDIRARFVITGEGLKDAE